VKLTKVFGLAALAAVAAMAFVGVASSSAAVLLESVICKEAPVSEHCPKGKAYDPTVAGFDIHAELKAGTTAKLEAGPIEDECTKSLVLLDKIEYKPHSIHGRIHELTFGGTCTCTKQVAIHLPWLALVTPDVKGGGGKLLASDGGFGSPGGEVVCSGDKCIYESTDATGVTITGGNPAIAKANVELVLNKPASSFFCQFAGNAHWIAEYQVTTPKPLWIALNLTI
jgi:hypothetical protein